jgi:outer membrane protein
MSRSIFAFTLAALVTGGLTARIARADDSKIAYVDLQRALEETNEGKAAKAKLKSDFDKKQQELDAKQEEIKKMKEDLDKKSSLMKPEALQKAQQDLQTRFVQLQETFQRLQKDLAVKEQEATRGILTKLSQVVQGVAEREHFSMVLERNSAVVYGQPSLDITNEVIRLYNSASGANGSNKKK